MGDTVLAVNVGNTTTKFGVGADGKLVATLETTTALSQTADEAFMALSSFMLSAGVVTAGAHMPIAVAPVAGVGGTFGANGVASPDSPAAEDDMQLHGILASVVPSLTDTWTQALARMCTSRPLVVGPGLKTGLKMAYNDPGELGADRVAYIVAAKQRFGSSTVVVSLGTTTNIDLIDDKGQFAGGVIAPGMRLGAAALANQAARLPVVECKAPAAVVGKRTRDAMQSGIVLGEVARIDGLVDMIWREAGYETDVVVTGADARAICALMRHEAHVAPHLTLEGLLALCTLNPKRR